MNTHSATLNGSSQYFTANDSASLSLTGDCTFSAWIKIVNLPASSDLDSFYVKQATAGNQRAYSLNLENAAGTYNLYFYCTPAGDGSGQTVSRVAWTPSTGVWYFVAATHDTSGNVKFYVGDQSTSPVQQGATQAGAATSIFDSSALFEIGFGSESTGYNYLDGQIDDCRVYNSVRTEANLQSDYNVELVGNEANLQGYWTLNNILTDATANANNLTNVNSATFTSDVPFGSAGTILGSDRRRMGR